MRSFLSILGNTWRYRLRLGAALLFAILGAFLWGANLSAVYPVMEVLFREQSIQSWLRERVAKAQSQLQALDALNGHHRGGEPDAVDSRRLKREELVWKIRFYQRLETLASEHLPEGRFATLALVEALSVLGMFLAGVCRFCNEVLIGQVTQKVIYDLRSRLFARALRMEMVTLTTMGSAELMARFTNDMETIGTGIKMALGKAVREPLRIVVCIALACWLNWRLTLAVLLFLPAFLGLLSLLSAWLRKASRRHLEAIASLYEILQESFQGIKLIKAFQLEPWERRRFRSAGRQYYRQAMRIVVLESVGRPLMETGGMLAVAVALLAGGYLVTTHQTHLFGIRLTDGPLSTSTLMLIYAALLGITDPLRKLSNFYGRIQAAQAASDRLLHYLNEQPLLEVPQPRAIKLRRHTESIEFDHVWFEYEEGNPVLRDICLQIRSGEFLALVGPNGSGKSTLVSLLPRLYDPTRGAIRIDGYDLRQVQLRSLRRQIGYMTQEVVLFNDTIYNNIRLGRPSASPREVYEAAHKAFADQFIRELPDGYQTLVGELGSRLSGGQRQRIALARVILRNPSILILDEATSAVDPESEQLIRQALEEFCQGRTTLAISHRLDTLRSADRIVVLDRGELVEVGTHEALLASCELYRRLSSGPLRQTA
jgi:subfamily B ATP-binding cassette protein MsbA